MKRPPLVKGGQGRTAGDVTGDACSLFTIAALVAVAVLILFVWKANV